MGDKAGDRIGLAVHNPSKFAMSQVKVPVPNRHFKVSVGHEWVGDHLIHYNHGILCLTET
jgi:hypothetical protein